jgi:hypothetical protein
VWGASAQSEPFHQTNPRILGPAYHARGRRPDVSYLQHGPSGEHSERYLIVSGTISAQRSVFYRAERYDREGEGPHVGCGKEEEVRKKEAQARKWAEDLRRQEEEASKRLDEEARHIELDILRKSEEAARKENEVKRKEEEARLKEEAALAKEEEI